MWTLIVHLCVFPAGITVGAPGVPCDAVHTYGSEITFATEAECVSNVMSGVAGSVQQLQVLYPDREFGYRFACVETGQGI